MFNYGHSVLSLSAWVVGILALTPGMYRWWSGRRLSADDPALPERLYADRVRRAPVTAFVIALILALAWPHAIWAIPLTLLTQTLAAYPLRRRLFGETWTLPAYLVWTLRATVALWGFHLLLLAMPLLVLAARKHGLTIALVLLIVLEAWSWWYPRVLLALVGAQRLPPEQWAPGFDRVLGGARVPAPHVWHTGPPGSRIANALALPTLGTCHVLFTDTLLERLTEEERTAVLAHEVSHLELFTTALLRRWHVATLARIVTGASLALVVQYVEPGRAWIAWTTWPILVLGSIVLRGRAIRTQETPSDLRAVELCGNAEAVISGLIKVHETARLPRRWAASFERRASHPSLARRIQAIRSAAGLSEHASSARLPIVLRGDNDRTAVVLETERVRHLSGVPNKAETLDTLLTSAEASVALPYASVAELRVAVGRDHRPILTLADQTGRRWTTRLSPEAVPQVQEALDLVDARLPAAVPAFQDPRRHVRVPLAAIVAAAFVAMPSVAALLVAALAIVTPSQATVWAAAVAALADGLFAAARARSSARVALDFAVVAAGVWTLWRLRRTTLQRIDDRWVHAVLAVFTMLLWGAVLWAEHTNLIALHIAVRQQPALLVLPLAVATAWIRSGTLLSRAAPLPLLLSVGSLVLATPMAVRAVLRDPLHVATTPIAIRRTRLEPMHVLATRASAGLVAFSPSGRWFAATEDDEYNDEDVRLTQTYDIGNVDGRRQTLRADALAFLDDESVVLLVRRDDSYALQQRSLADVTRTTWEVALQRAQLGTFAVNATTRRWSLHWTSGRTAALTRLEGEIGTPFVRERRWTTARGPVYVAWLAGADAEPLGMEYDYSRRLRLFEPWRTLLDLPWHVPLTMRLGTHAQSGLRSQLTGECYDAAPGQPVLCVVRDGTGSQVWTWDRSGLRSAGQLDGELIAGDRGTSGWLIIHRQNHLLALDPAGHGGLDLGRDCPPLCLASPSYSGSVLGGLLIAENRTDVATYRVAAIP
jgi:Zn-dependent protease with chaperone function